MSFINAIEAAPADVDFVSYKNVGGWVVIYRRSDGIWDTCANLTPDGYNVFVSGVNAQRRSLWSYESRTYICGDVGQLDREEA